MTIMLDIMTEIEESHSEIIKAFFRYCGDYKSRNTNEVSQYPIEVKIVFEGNELYSKDCLACCEKNIVTAIVFPMLILKSTPGRLWEKDIFRVAIIVQQKEYPLVNLTELTKNSNFLLLAFKDSNMRVHAQA